jgi:hypothetical protein
MAESKGEKETCFSYCRAHRIHNFGKQRLVANFDQLDLSGSLNFNSNRLIWHSVGVARIRRHRRPAKFYHEESKVEGLDKYQVRDFQAISRIGPVAIAYSRLRPPRTKCSCTSFNVNSR